MRHSAQEMVQYGFTAWGRRQGRRVATVYHGVASVFALCARSRVMGFGWPRRSPDADAASVRSGTQPDHDALVGCTLHVEVMLQPRMHGAQLRACGRARARAHLLGNDGVQRLA